MNINRIIVRYGEIALKGQNRARFEKQLRRNIRYRLAHAGIPWRAIRAHDHIYIEVPEAEAGAVPGALDALRTVAGIVWFAPAHWQPRDRGLADPAGEATWTMLERNVREMALAAPAGTSFAVRVNRVDKSLPMKSPEIERRLGTMVLQETGCDRVDMKHPQRWFHVDIYPQGACFYERRERGLGGLPVEPGNRVLVLLSGGIDSPVAAHLMAKRGCAVDFIHFAASPLHQQQAHEYKVARLAATLSNVTLRSDLHVVPYTHFDLAMLGANTGYDLNLFRRFMARSAEKLAERTGAVALVMGDSLGQVASQTLANLRTTGMAVRMPVLRPLIAFDKQEIVRLAREIATYETSIEPYKDCCALLSRQPQTRSDNARLERLEARYLPAYDDLVERTLADDLRLEFRCGRARGGPVATGVGSAAG